MSETRRLQRLAIGLLVSGVVLTAAAGCPSSNDSPANSNNNAPPAVVEQSAAPPVSQPQVPSDPPPRTPAIPGTKGRPTNNFPVQEGDSPIFPAGKSGQSPAASEPGESSTAGEAEKEPFDPIKVNGPIFVGWPKPKLALVISGRQEGYIEPCGCAGLDRMKGGMSRRHALLKTLRERGWPLVGLDVGGIARGFGRQAELKFQVMVDGMRKAGYEAITLGKSDLRLPAAELLSVTAGTADEPSPFHSANVALFGFDAKMTAPWRVIEAAGMKIGVTGVLGKKWQAEINNSEIEMIDPETALAKVLPELKNKADYLVLLAHATMEETRRLAEEFPEFDLVITAGGAPEPPAKALRIGGKTILVEVGEKGMDAIVLGLFDDPLHPVRYQRVPLDSRFPASVEMVMLMRLYQDQLKREGFSGLGIRPVPHPQNEINGRFVGSKQCETCHEEVYDVWRRSGHGRAYRTLTELDPPRNFDPECVSCHVVGWHPTGFFPYKGGYRSLEKTPKLINTGCETCHGPGENHAKAELGDDEELIQKLRRAMVVTKEESQKRQCVTCHDLDNSPDFDFDTYWPHVKHYEQ